MAMNAASAHTADHNDPAEARLREHFFGWQCRLRQFAVRKNNGQPSPGMCPNAVVEAEGVVLEEITVLIVPSDPAETTAEFRHMARRTQDPKERLDSALKVLSAAFYQYAKGFGEEMTALFAADSNAARKLRDAGRCRLDFDEKNQAFRLPCAVRTLAEDEPAWQATYWHNRLFNPALPPDVIILGFRPDWSGSEAEPGVG
jgi:hypothetical protein